MSTTYARVEPLDSDLMNPVIAFRIGAIFAGIAVFMGGFAEHWLRLQVVSGALAPERLAYFHTGVTYQLFHALAIMVVASGGGLLWQRHYVRWAVIAWSIGIVLFSGTLYALALMDTSLLAVITPFGGFAFLVGWVLATLSAHMYKHAETP